MVQTLSGIHVDMRTNSWNQTSWERYKKFILKNMKKLKTIEIEGDIDGVFSSEQVDFISTIVRNSASTLETFMPFQFLIPDVEFPKLKYLGLSYHALNTISVEEFQTQMAIVLNRAKQLEVFHILSIPKNNISEYITNNYASHCVYGAGYWTPFNLSGYLPVKMTTAYESRIENEFNYCVEYLKIQIPIFCNDEIWEDFKEKLNVFPNLKGIFLLGYDEGLETFYEAVAEAGQNVQLWKDNLFCLRTTGRIQILTKSEWERQEHTYAKHLKWRFHFGLRNYFEFRPFNFF